MKLLHLGDLHLGKRVGEFSLLQDQRFVLGQVVRLAAQHKVDAVLLAGDLYDKPVPPAEAVELLDWFLTALCSAEHTVLAVSGNHDSPERLAFASSLLQRAGVYIAGEVGAVPQRVTLTDEYGQWTHHAAAVCQAAAMLAPFLGERPANTDAAVAAALAARRMRPGAMCWWPTRLSRRAASSPPCATLKLRRWAVRKMWMCRALTGTTMWRWGTCTGRSALATTACGMRARR